MYRVTAILVSQQRHGLDGLPVQLIHDIRFAVNLIVSSIVPLARSLPSDVRIPRSAGEGRRRGRHVAQELVAAVTLDRGQVVRDQSLRPLDRDLDTVM